MEHGLLEVWKWPKISKDDAAINCCGTCFAWSAEMTNNISVDDATINCCGTLVAWSVEMTKKYP